jgi:hypothetical protein
MRVIRGLLAFHTKKNMRGVIVLRKTVTPLLVFKPSEGKFENRE